jgi:hypothetical protein
LFFHLDHLSSPQAHTPTKILSKNPLPFAFPRLTTKELTYADGAQPFLSSISSGSVLELLPAARILRTVHKGPKKKKDFIVLVSQASAPANEMSEESGTVYIPSALISKGFCWFDFGENIGHEDIPLDLSSRSFIPLSRFVSFVLVSPPRFWSFPRPLSSTFYLNDTCWVFILSLRWIFFSSKF